MPKITRLPKRVPTPESASDIRLVRSHPTNPIVVTQADVKSDGFPRILIRTPRVLTLRGESSYRFDLFAKLALPAGYTAQVVAQQPLAHEAGFTVDSGILGDESEVVLFLRNLTRRAVVFNDGAVLGELVFQRRGALEIEVDCELPPPPAKKEVSRPHEGGEEGDEAFEN